VVGGEEQNQESFNLEKGNNRTAAESSACGAVQWKTRTQMTMRTKGRGYQADTLKGRAIKATWQMIKWDLRPEGCCTIRAQEVGTRNAGTGKLKHLAPDLFFIEEATVTLGGELRPFITVLAREISAGMDKEGGATPEGYYAERMNQPGRGRTSALNIQNNTPRTVRLNRGGATLTAGDGGVEKRCNRDLLEDITGDK